MSLKIYDGYFSGFQFRNSNMNVVKHVNAACFASLKSEMQNVKPLQTAVIKAKTVLLPKGGKSVKVTIATVFSSEDGAVWTCCK